MKISGEIQDIKHSKTTVIFIRWQARYVPALGGSCAVAGGCCCCTDTASGFVPRLHSQPSCGGSLWRYSCKRPPAPQQAELQEVSEYAPWTLDLCNNSDHKFHKLVSNLQGAVHLAGSFKARHLISAKSKYSSKHPNSKYIKYQNPKKYVNHAMPFDAVIKFT